MGDYTVLDIAVSASLDAKVTVTGAYDDAPDAISVASS